MTQGKDISGPICNQMVGMPQAEMIFIAIDVKSDVSEDTLRKIYKRWEERGDCENAERSERLTILDKHDVWHIEAHITTNREIRRQPLSEIINQVNLPVCPKTLKTIIINNIGLEQ